jgi:hypothetical protein
MLACLERRQLLLNSEKQWQCSLTELFNNPGEESLRVLKSV